MSISIDQYVISTIYKFPSLFNDMNYYQSKMKVLDHLLNTIGNGISNGDELLEHLSDINNDLTMDDIKPYITGEPLFYGYFDVTTYTDKETGEIHHHPANISKSIISTEADKVNHTDVVLWLSVLHYKFRPYPNFLKGYSTVYRCPSYLNLHKSFIEGAIEFYKYCLELLIEDETRYHNSFPCASDAETKLRLRELRQHLNTYSSNEQISEEYGVTFTGDLYQFEVDRWNKEKSRIILFINETISLLKAHL